MNEREAIGQKARYELFKRDHFKCTRCGAQPAEDNDVTLELDHIHPVALGGTNAIDNLQTLCKNCNRGKRDTPDTNVPESLEAKAQRIAEDTERQAQIEGAAEAIREEQTRLERLETEQIWNIADILFGNTQTEIASADASSIKTFIKKIGFRETRDAALRAIERADPDQGPFRYFCGICHKKSAAKKDVIKRPPPRSNPL